MAVVTQIQLRRDTAANWTSINPTLASGEMGFETDTGLFKIGTGSTAWTSLSYAVSVTATNTVTLTNKTLTSPVIGTIVNTGTLTLPTTTGTLALTSQLYTAPTIGSTSITSGGTFTTLPGVTSVNGSTVPSGDTLVGRATTDTLTNKTLTAPVITYSVNAQTGTTFTPALSDAASIVTLSNASAISVTIPTNASVAYAVGTQLNFIQIGAGQVTISAVTPGTTTIASTGGTAASPKIRAQYASATAIKVATDTWYVVGDIA